MRVVGIRCGCWAELGRFCATVYETPDNERRRPGGGWTRPWVTIGLVCALTCRPATPNRLHIRCLRVCARRHNCRSQVRSVIQSCRTPPARIIVGTDELISVSPLGSSPRFLVVSCLKKLEPRAMCHAKDFIFSRAVGIMRKACASWSHSRTTTPVRAVTTVTSRKLFGWNSSPTDNSASLSKFSRR